MSLLSCLPLLLSHVEYTNVSCSIPCRDVTVELYQFYRIELIMQFFLISLFSYFLFVGICRLFLAYIRDAVVKSPVITQFYSPYVVIDLGPSWRRSIIVIYTGVHA